MKNARTRFDLLRVAPSPYLLKFLLQFYDIATPGKDLIMAEFCCVFSVHRVRIRHVHYYSKPLRNGVKSINISFTICSMSIH